jgi:hypothetical protein
MSTINLESRESIFFGIHFIVASNWGADHKRFLDFQGALLGEGLEFYEIVAGQRNYTLTRREPSSLQVKVGSVGPQVSEIIIVTPARPNHTLEFFLKEAEAVCSAYLKVWAGSSMQVLQSDVTLRHLYSCDCHAFKYLWEERLGQQESDLQYLGGRPVLGGGLRLVLPRGNQWKENVEIKVESYFGEPQKVFIETLFIWPEPRPIVKATDFNATELLTTVEKYATGDVCNFLLKPQKGDDDAGRA